MIRRRISVSFGSATRSRTHSRHIDNLERALRGSRRIRRRGRRCVASALLHPLLASSLSVAPSHSALLALRFVTLVDSSELAFRASGLAAAGSLSATRRPALRARGLAAISASVGTRLRRVSSFALADQPQSQTGFRGGHRQSDRPHAKGPFHPAVFQRVICQDRETTAGAQDLPAFFQQGIEFAEFVVYGDSQGLEGSGRRIVARAAANAGRDHRLSQFGCGPDRPRRRLLAAPNYLFRDPARRPFLAELVDDVGQFLFVERASKSAADSGRRASMRMSSGASAPKLKPRSGVSR